MAQARAMRPKAVAEGGTHGGGALAPSARAVLGSRCPKRAGGQSTTVGARPRARCELLRRARRRRPRAAQQGAEGTASRVRVGRERWG